MIIRQAVKTDIGKRRRENQDAFGDFPDMSLYIVADGLGGHAGGKAASALSVAAIRESLAQTENTDLTPLVDQCGSCSLAGRRLVIAVDHANERVLQASQTDPAMQGMGTTVAAMLFDHERELVAICHVGDTRVYRIRDATIDELTQDHTVAQQLFNDGKIDLEGLKTSPHRHLLTHAVGIGKVIHPTLRLEKPLPGDVFVLASDGVHNAVSNEEMLGVIRQAGPDLDSACTRLIALANERGGKDNSTVLLVACEPSSPTSASSAPPE